MCSSGVLLQSALPHVSFSVFSCLHSRSRSRMCPSLSSRSCSAEVVAHIKLLCSIQGFRCELALEVHLWWNSSVFRGCMFEDAGYAVAVFQPRCQTIACSRFEVARASSLSFQRWLPSEGQDQEPGALHAKALKRRQSRQKARPRSRSRRCAFRKAGAAAMQSALAAPSAQTFKPVAAGLRLQPGSTSGVE